MSYLQIYFVKMFLLEFGLGELVKTRVVFSQSEEERWVFAVITDCIRKQKKELYDLVVINAEEHALNPFATHVAIDDIKSMKTFGKSLF